MYLIPTHGPHPPPPLTALGQVWQGDAPPELVAHSIRFVVAQIAEAPLLAAAGPYLIGFYVSYSRHVYYHRLYTPFTELSVCNAVGTTYDIFFFVEMGAAASAILNGFLGFLLVFVFWWLFAQDYAAPLRFERDEQLDDQPARSLAPYVCTIVGAISQFSALVSIVGFALIKVQSAGVAPTPTPHPPHTPSVLPRLPHLTRRAPIGSRVVPAIVAPYQHCHV